MMQYKHFELNIKIFLITYLIYFFFLLILINQGATKIAKNIK